MHPCAVVSVALLLALARPVPIAAQGQFRADSVAVRSRDLDARLYPSHRAQPASPRLIPPPASGADERLVRGTIGGLIGAVAGLVTCTAISNAIADAGAGFSTCTTKGNLLFAGGGFALGFLIGWLTGSEP